VKTQEHRTFFSYLFGLILLGGCATKLRHPIQDLQTPETTGGFGRTSIELGQVLQSQSKVDLSTTVPFGLTTTESHEAFFGADVSLLEFFDLTWKHSASAPSLFGIKFQFLGNSKTANPSGHSLGISAQWGGNEHSVESGADLEFEVSSSRYSFLHGWWATSWWQLYDSLTFARTEYDGKITDPFFSGAFGDTAQEWILGLGTQLRWNSFALKGEYSFIKQKWSKNEDQNLQALAFSFSMIF
jgi:hypothetical protein